jgi:N6-adenosine-specific RNA methylase IME4
MDWPFNNLQRERYGVIYADPPWSFECWSDKGTARAADNHYRTMATDEIALLPVSDLAAPNCALFMWACWPTMKDAFNLIESWGFKYKTCGFTWLKAHVRQVDMFRDDADAQAGMGYWTRANSEVCLLATRGKPKRLNADVRQGIIEPRREHSRKPDCVYDRIERLVAGPYCELFARNSPREGWDKWGNQLGKFAA